MAKLQEENGGSDMVVVDSDCPKYAEEMKALDNLLNAMQWPKAVTNHFIRMDVVQDYIKATLETNDSQQNNVVEDVLQHMAGYLACLRESHLRESSGEEVDSLTRRLIRRLSVGLTGITSLGGADNEDMMGQRKFFLFHMLYRNERIRGDLEKGKMWMAIEICERLVRLFLAVETEPYGHGDCFHSDHYCSCYDNHYSGGCYGERDHGADSRVQYGSCKQYDSDRYVCDRYAHNRYSIGEGSVHPEVYNIYSLEDGALQGVLTENKFVPAL
ncbi:hypothetical protein SUGI_0632870 [Cryptomeria japonica]|nr:hypothetical protein SUGI_0632870 [Cryptomeria japonica]